MKRIKGNSAIVIFGSIVLLCIGVYNICTNGKSFFEASVYQVISLIFVLLITFYLTQMKNEERRKIDMLDRMLIDLQNELNADRFIKYETEDDIHMALLSQKSVANRLAYLRESGLFPKIMEEIKYIDNEITHLREMYGEHMNDKEYMNKSKKDFDKYITNAEDKIFSVHLKLYE